MEEKEFMPSGHFYSPIPNWNEVDAKKSHLFDRTVKELPGIAMNDTLQNAWFQTMKKFYPEIPFPPTKQEGLRYYFENDAYSYTDAIMLYTFIRALQPKKIIEVGSGFTSAVMLDTIDRFVPGKTEVTFIEPFPEVLNQTLSPDDLQTHTLRQAPVQDIPLDLFMTLKEGDILFIDSTHVSKIGSDVNYLFFEILPRLNPGVYVHIHDIFFPFEYPEKWVLGDRRCWNEDYLVRAFLMFNDAYEIVYFNDYFHRKNPDAYQETPLCLNNVGGSLWLQKKR